MRNLYQSLLLLIAGSTQQELARQVRYLKVENQILRSKLPKRIVVTERERNRLAKFAAKLGSALNEIVHPGTLRRWIRALGDATKKAVGKRGRPKTQAEIRELVARLARENLGVRSGSGRGSETWHPSEEQRSAHTAFRPPVEV